MKKKFKDFLWEAQDTYNFVDQENNMMLHQNYSWDPNGDQGKQDAIGRTFRAYFTYGDERFMKGIENCWVKVHRKGWLRRFLFGDYYYQGYRHPIYARGEEKQPVGFSRDHTIYTILAFKYAGYSDEFLKDFVTHLRWKISDKYTFTLTTWLWARVLAGIKPYNAIFYPIQWLVLAGSLVWNKALYRCSGFGEESHQDNFIKIPNEMKPKKMRKTASWFYPIYALHLNAWKIRLLPDCWWKRALQKVAIGICPAHNYVIQLLLDSENRPPREDIDGYKPMAGGRWTGILNPWINDRDIHILKDPKLLEYNVLDVDYLKRLYYFIKCRRYI